MLPLLFSESRTRPLFLLGFAAFLGLSESLCFGQSNQENASQKIQQPQTAEEAAQSANSGNSPPVASQPGDANENRLGLALIKNLAQDQKAIWTSPAHVRLGEATWLVPFTGLTAGFIVTDRDANLHLGGTPHTLNRYQNYSNYGLASLTATGAGLYFLGKVTHDEHKRETGLLSGEAALDALAVTTTLGYAFGRERPNVDSFRGLFGQGGNSFPSSHASTA